MGNFIYHNKWHSFNHHTVPSPGYPDSAMDPIASQEFPFLGFFFNSIPLSSVEDVIVSYTDTNSRDWYNYYTLTSINSSDWSLWSSVRYTASGFRSENIRLSTVTFLYENWSDGYTGYTYWNGFSALIMSAYLNAFALSSARVWPLSTEGSETSGRGWHIALSGITWRTNVSAVNTRQKNFGPVALLTPNQDNTLFWDVSTAQTAYLTLTEDKTLTATRIFNAYKGGKYTLWVALDFCPLPEMDLYFDYETYRIQVVKFPRKDTYTSNTDVIRLSANNVTRIDFVYDGKQMLGKATHYKIFLPTTDDLYYQGLGNSLASNPAFAGGLAEPFNFLSPGAGLRILPFSNNFTEVSAVYISGSGVEVSYFGRGTVLITVNMLNASWPSAPLLASFPSLTGSFDRVVGGLSGGGDFKDIAYSDNLFATPAIASTPQLIFDNFPNPPYRFSKLKSTAVETCLSSLRVEINSGKDRDIKQVFINKGVAAINAPVINNVQQRYNFSNERQAVLFFNRIQSNIRLDVVFERQAPLRMGVNPLIWFDPIDDFTVSSVSNRVEKLLSKPDSSYFLSQSNIANRPLEVITPINRTLLFTNSGGLTTFATINRSLSSLRPVINSAPSTGIEDITTFTVVHPVSVQEGSEWVVWWLGDYQYGAGGSLGYGVVLSGDRICFGGFNPQNSGLSKIVNTIYSYKIEKDKPFLLTTVLEPIGASPQLKRSTVYINGSRLSLQPGLRSNLSLPLTSYNVSFGKAPGQNIYSNYKLLSFGLYRRALSPARISILNSHLLSKFNIPR